VLKQQILVLRDLEKKNASEIATLRTEVDSWKVQVWYSRYACACAVVRVLTPPTASSRSRPFKW
jgi:hypothetical protein